MANNISNETLNYLKNGYKTEFEVEAFIDWRNPVPDCIGYRVKYSHGLVFEIRVEQYTGLHFAYIYPGEEGFNDYMLAETEIHLLTEEKIRKIHDNIDEFIYMRECMYEEEYEYFDEYDEDSDC